MLMNARVGNGDGSARHCVWQLWTSGVWVCVGRVFGSGVDSGVFPDVAVSVEEGAVSPAVPILTSRG